MRPIADIGPAWPADWFADGIEDACAVFPLADIAPIVSEYCRDDARVELHWPWIAFALKNFHDRQARGRNQDDIPVKEVSAILQSIATQARGLNLALRQLDSTADAALSNDNQRKWIAICRARERLADVFAEPQPDPADRDPGAGDKFLEWGLFVEDVAQHAADAQLIMLQDAQARKERGQLLAGLGGLVSICGAVWESMVGRKPSAERIKLASGEDPPFVRFVTALCRKNGLSPPTISQVKRALRPER